MKKSLQYLMEKFQDQLMPLNHKVGVKICRIFNSAKPLGNLAEFCIKFLLMNVKSSIRKFFYSVLIVN